MTASELSEMALRWFEDLDKPTLVGSDVAVSLVCVSVDVPFSVLVEKLREAVLRVERTVVEASGTVGSCWGTWGFCSFAAVVGGVVGAVVWVPDVRRPLLASYTTARM